MTYCILSAYASTFTKWSYVNTVNCLPMHRHFRFPYRCMFAFLNDIVCYQYVDIFILCHVNALVFHTTMTLIMWNLHSNSTMHVLHFSATKDMNSIVQNTIRTSDSIQLRTISPMHIGANHELYSQPLLIIFNLFSTFAHKPYITCLIDFVRFISVHVANIMLQQHKCVLAVPLPFLHLQLFQSYYFTVKQW